MARKQSILTNEGWIINLDLNGWKIAAKEIGYRIEEHGGPKYYWYTAGPFNNQASRDEAVRLINARANQLITYAKRQRQPPPITEFLKNHPKQYTK